MDLSFLDIGSVNYLDPGRKIRKMFVGFGITFIGLLTHRYIEQTPPGPCCSDKSEHVCEGEVSQAGSSSAMCNSPGIRQERFGSHGRNLSLEDSYSFGMSQS